jgi:hypothetical protein
MAWDCRIFAGVPAVFAHDVHLSGQEQEAELPVPAKGGQADRRLAVAAAFAPLQAEPVG